MHTTLELLEIMGSHKNIETNNVEAEVSYIGF